MKPIPLSKKQLKFLRSLPIKKYRYRHQAYLAEGNKLLEELLRRNAPIQRILATQDWLDKTKIRLNADKLQIISLQDYRQISQLSTPPQVLTLVEMKATHIDSIILKTNHHFVLAQVKDPGNLGTLIRLSDWFGMPYLICSKECVDCYNPKTVQASMGSIASVQVFYEDLDSFFPSYPDIPTFAATLNGQNLFDITFPSSAFLLLGSESHGISPDLLAQHPHTPITIPGSGNAESLNVAIAGSIIAAQAFKANCSP